MALRSIDTVPIPFMEVSEDDQKLVVPAVFLNWLSNMVDTINEAFLELNAMNERLKAGGL